MLPGDLFLPAVEIGASVPSRPDNVTDGELCDALASGSLWAVDLLYTRIEDTVDTVLFRVLGATDIDRENLLQRSLQKIIAFIMARRFTGSCSLKSWVALLTQEVALDALRACARQRAVLSAAVGFDTVLSALAMTRKEWAAAVILHDLLGYGVTEISCLTGVSRSAAQVRLVRGRQDVTDRIGDVVTGVKRKKRDAVSATA
ncbi:MAG TPA: sigma factor-like helix-turn-helix DNA-binding protein [Polyangia bacterium]|nr:sigma factor-like helix-turn-helix DNA-binding protein [Polyangia bacterium]